MASKRNLVNLDAMIKRADFALKAENSGHYENVSTIAIRDFTSEGLIGRNLRKPDFQRETNHWTPEQVVSLIECFINGDLIPSVILWQSDSFLFVIDGGHRLSVLKAWVEDDYGDGANSLAYFGDAISKNQKQAAERTRKLISERIGSWQQFKIKIDNSQIDAQVSSVMTRGIPIQWVKGDAQKAESSFFKINTQGTPLDDLEESLLKFRKRPIPIASRAVIRAGKGHKYWSNFDTVNLAKLEGVSKELHTLLFDPDLSSPTKTLDLPLGGSKGVRAALQVLIEYFSVACLSQSLKSIDIEFGTDDLTGDQTIDVLTKALNLARRITGNSKGSLGLHPAVYFYGPSGVHSIPMFLGTAKLITEALYNNNSLFFKNFTLQRENIEKTLIENKELIATILQKSISKKRVQLHYTILKNMYQSYKDGKSISQADILEWTGVKGPVIVGNIASSSIEFTDSIKSKTFINTALKSAVKCPVCKGYLDTQKSVSYDHIQRVEDGGLGDDDNCQLMHPYCNQSIKN